MVLAELSRRLMINKIKKQAFLFQNEVFLHKPPLFFHKPNNVCLYNNLKHIIHANDYKHVTEQPSSSRHFVVFIPQNLTLQEAIK